MKYIVLYNPHAGDGWNDEKRSAAEKSIGGECSFCDMTKTDYASLFGKMTASVLSSSAETALSTASSTTRRTSNCPSIFSTSQAAAETTSSTTSAAVRGATSPSTWTNT